MFRGLEAQTGIGAGDDYCLSAEICIGQQRTTKDLAGEKVEDISDGWHCFKSCCTILSPISRNVAISVIEGLVSIVRTRANGLYIYSASLLCRQRRPWKLDDQASLKPQNPHAPQIPTRSRRVVMTPASTSMPTQPIMPVVKQHHLQPTRLIPNSPLPLLHYPKYLTASPTDTASSVLQTFDLFTANGWPPQWIFRYGPTQPAHYHSRAHECMVVLHGQATIRFGVADSETGGVEIAAEQGDVFIIPAGVAHKTFNTSAGASGIELISPGDGHGIAKDQRGTLTDVDLSGFVMMGAYPRGGEWDFATGGEHDGVYEEVWNVELPALDPVLGDHDAGLRTLWTR